MEIEQQSQEPSVQTVDQKALEFHQRYFDHLVRKAKQKLGRKATPEDFANRILLRFCDAFKKDAAFREFVNIEGIEAVSEHPFWPNWIRWTANDLFRKYYRSLPHIITEMARALLQLADGHDHGLLNPLVSSRRRDDEDKLLGQLLDDKSICENSTLSNEALPPHFIKRDPTSFVTTAKGNRRLEKILGHGLMKKVPALEIQSIWKYEENAPIALQITLSGRNFADSGGDGEGVLPFDEEQIPEHADANGYLTIEDKLDDSAFRNWLNPDRFAQVIFYLERQGFISSRDCEIYIDRKKGSGLDEVARKHGVGKSTVHRIENAIDRVFENPEAQQLILARFPLKSASSSKLPTIEHFVEPKAMNRKK